MACILLWSSAVRVHDSQAYRKMDVTRERISRILDLREILLSIQIGVSLVNAAVVCNVCKCTDVLRSHLAPRVFLKLMSVEYSGQVQRGSCCVSPVSIAAFE